jgi:hypothetical protein
MYDDFRNDSSTSYYEDDQTPNNYQPAGNAVNSPRRASSRGFLGMTSVQRFVLTVMLMITVCVIGSLFLFVTGKIAF